MTSPDLWSRPKDLVAELRSVEPIPRTGIEPAGLAQMLAQSQTVQTEAWAINAIITAMTAKRISLGTRSCLWHQEKNAEGPFRTRAVIVGTLIVIGAWVVTSWTGLSHHC